MGVISLKPLMSSGMDYVSWLPCPPSDYNCCASILCWSPRSLILPMMFGSWKLLVTGASSRSWVYWSAWVCWGLMGIMAGSSCFCSSVCYLNSAKVPKSLTFRLLRPIGILLEFSLSKWIVLPLLSTHWKKQINIDAHNDQPLRSYTTTYRTWTATHAAHSTSRQWPLSSKCDFVRS